ncbi:MAG: oligoendopeptidase F [Defluviitaleaceae bacterium]|nr:oligoendopeptidase F [Defluviitaleaceae bacterium]
MEVKQKTRAEIPSEFKWRINDLIASDEAWQEGINKIKEDVKELANFKNQLGKIKSSNAAILLECLTKQAEIGEKFTQLYVYANMRLHEDANDIAAQEFADKAGHVHVDIMEAESFIEPEILSIDEQELQVCIQNTPGLELYNQYFDNLFRQKAHVLSAKEEEILSQVHELGMAPSNIFSMFENADIKFGTLTDEEGNQVELTHGRYGNMLKSSNRDVRKKAWNTYHDSYWYIKNTLTATYNASVKKDVFFAKIRKYPSAMEASLFTDNIPTAVYTNLIDTVHEYLPQMHRYMKLRKKALNLQELHAYDLYVPMIKQVNNKMAYKDAVEVVLKSLAPLGAEYIDISRKGLTTGGWVDIYENSGKMNTAYSWGAYGGHPYILLNYDNTMDDMFTLAHELGHAMHSYYSWDNQPYIYSDYSIFLAEVASTVNEALLMEYLLENNDNPDMEAFLIDTWLEQFRFTLFRQALFAEFEMIVYRMAQEGKPLTVDALNKVYRSLNRQYYGDALVIDDKLDLEWARISHFYDAFYVFQYATGYSAAMAFSKQILKDNASTIKYLDFLKSGSSDYSINILKKAGVDMSVGVEPIKEALDKFGELIGKMEEIL